MPRRIFRPENMTNNMILGRKTPYGGSIGCGMGSVLLNRGGGGGGSSYSSPNEYHEITGRPIPIGGGLSTGFHREVPMNTIAHKHLKGVNEKLQNLLAKPSMKKKNITFNA
jgi:hypothetical protein